MSKNAPATLVARRSDSGARVTIGDTPWETLRLLSDSRMLCCEICGGQLLLKAGDVRAHHFAHISLTNCASANFEPETESHRSGKLLLYQQFRIRAVDAALERYFPETEQRADVYIQMSDAGYALEFQQANNSADHWAERHRQYQSLGLRDIWFLGQVRYQESGSEGLRPISRYDPARVPRDAFEATAGAFRIREMEKAMLIREPSDNLADQLHLLYYLDPESALLTILIPRDVQHNTLRAYRYRLPLVSAELRDSGLWTPLLPLLEDYRRQKAP